PPGAGGIATWAGILRDCSAARSCRFLFESVAPKRPDGRGHLPLKLLDAGGLVCRLIRRLARDRPDVTHVHSCLSPLGVWRDLLVAHLVAAWRVPLVVHYRGSLPAALGRMPAPSRFALRSLITIADVNVALTGESASLLERFCGISRAAYLPNFIDDRHIQLSSVEAREKGSESRRVRAAYVGELSTDKGTLDLLQAARALPHVDFVLMGEISPGIREAVGSAPANVRATGVLT